MKKLSFIFAIIAAVVFMGSMCSPDTTNSNATTSENYNANSEQDIQTEEVVVAEYTDVTPTEAKDLIDNNSDLTIIDVSPYFDEGHLPGAVNYYVGDGSLDEAIPTLDKNAPYLVYCHFESASRAGAQALVDAGFTNVYRLIGDYPGWVAAGYEVEQ